MPRSVISPSTPDLFDYVFSTPTQRTRRTLANVNQPMPELGDLTDIRLAYLLRELTGKPCPIRFAKPRSRWRMSAAIECPALEPQTRHEAA
jgi:hypothetical protein